MIKKFKFSEWKKTDKKIKAGKPGEVLERGCPKCKSMNVIPTGKLHKGNRTYKCLDCGSYFASPTTWAWCTKRGKIGKDLISNDCLNCPIAKAEGIDVKLLAGIGKGCPYFAGRTYADEK